MAPSSDPPLRPGADFASYPGLWAGMLAQWSRPGPIDRAWLLFSANYLCNTAGVRWALDPLTPRGRIPSAPPVDVSALEALDYVVLTHRHTDHLDLDLLARLRDYPARWVIPAFLLEALEPLHLPPGKTIVPRPMETLHLGPLALTPFEGLHWEPDPVHPARRHGVPSLGYLAGFSGRRWLFPGDIRTYDPSTLPVFGPLDGLVAHLWLGRGQAQASHPPLLEAFGRFCLALEPQRILLTHIDEWSRPLPETYTRHHARLVVEWFAVHAPGLPVTPVMMGEEVDL